MIGSVEECFTILSKMISNLSLLSNRFIPVIASALKTCAGVHCVAFACLSYTTTILTALLPAVVAVKHELNLMYNDFIKIFLPFLALISSPWDIAALMASVFHVAWPAVITDPDASTNLYSVTPGRYPKNPPVLGGARGALRFAIIVALAAATAARAAVCLFFDPYFFLNKGVGGILKTL